MADYNDRLIRLKSDFEESNRITKRSLYYDNYIQLINSDLADMTSSKERITYLVNNISSNNT